MNKTNDDFIDEVNDNFGIMYRSLKLFMKITWNLHEVPHSDKLSCWYCKRMQKYLDKWNNSDIDKEQIRHFMECPIWRHFGIIFHDELCQRLCDYFQ